MNEVTKIHLCRQAFTISVDAHHELKSYLGAIKKQVNDNEVVEEIELRMAELLIEHGLNANKVILPSDVDFLKEQLGSPSDFVEDGNESHKAEFIKTENKKLFRDTGNAMVAGVASGLSEYFGLDVLLIRVLFVIIFLLTAGWGILIYIIMWLLVPEARTPSDRLLMAGKPVTVNSLKDIVERADVKGAAQRANATLAAPINAVFRILLKVVGLLFILFGLSALFGMVATATYVLLHSSAKGTDIIFPVGLREHLLVYIALLVVGFIVLFIILFGIAIFRRKWPIRNWVTGILVGFILIGFATSAALGADVYPNIHDRYNSNLHTTVRNLPPFTAVNTTDAWADISYQTSDKYYVSLNYYDHPDVSLIQTNVTKGVLLINTSQFSEHRQCRLICLPFTYNIVITIHSPSALQFINQDGAPVTPPIPEKVYPPLVIN